MLTGCWDKIEIDQRGFVEVILVDLPPPGYEEKTAESVEGIPGIEKQVGKQIKFTYIFPNTSLLAGEGGGGGNEPGFIAMTSIATSMTKADRYIDARISRRLFFGHTQVVVFSEKFLKDPELVKKVVDHLRRNPEFNRTIKLLMIYGEASKIGEIKPKGEKLMFRYITGILHNEETNGRIIEVDLNEFVVKSTHPEKAAILPVVSVEKDELKISGVGLIKDNKLVGYLSEYDSLYFNTLIGRRSGGRETINIGDFSVDFATNNTKKTMKLINSGPNNLEIEIKVRIEGTLVGAEYDREIFDEKLIETIQKELNEMSEESCKFVIKKLQKDYKVDALETADYLRKFHPDIWENVKDRWDEVFQNIKITPTIDHKIRRIGSVK